MESLNSSCDCKRDYDGYCANPDCECCFSVCDGVCSTCDACGNCMHFDDTAVKWD